MHFLASLNLNGVLISLVAVMVLGPTLEIAIRKGILVDWMRPDNALVNYVQVFTVFFGLMLGLVAIDLWQKQDAAEMNTVTETDRIRILLALTSRLSGDVKPVSNALGDYAQSVLKKEWPIMLAGTSEELFVASPELDLVRETIMDLRPTTPTEQAAFQELLSSYEQIVEARQRRLPILLWIVLGFGAGFTWIGTWFIPARHIWSQMLLSSITIGYLYLLLYLIVVLEHPFLGVWRVEPVGYQRVLEIFH